jgi:hypothetical protein
MNALKILSDLDYQTKRHLYASMPEHAIPRTRFSDKTANGLTQCILTWLRLHGHYATRIVTTGRKLKDTVTVDVLGRNRVLPGQWIPGTTRTGTSDIHAIINGRHASIEVKVGKDKMSPAQEKTKKDVERSGGVYFIAKDFESFYQWYNSQLENNAQ